MSGSPRLFPVIGLLAFLFLSACGPSEAEHIVLSREFTNRQFTVGEKPQLTASDLFPVNGQELRIGRQQYITVYEFPNGSAARAHMKNFQEDGAPMHMADWTWPDTPHLYQSRNSIVVYIGRNGEITDILEELYGPQVAGGSTAASSAQGGSVMSAMSEGLVSSK